METPQPPPQVLVSGHIVIQGELPKLSGPSPDPKTVPIPPSSSWWQIWRWPPETVLAAATVVLAVATIILAVFTLALVNVGFKQAKILSRTDTALHHSAQTVEKFRLFTEATERAWIPPIAEIAGPLAKDGSGLKLTLKFIMKNIGHTPAMFVFPSAHLFLRQRGHPDYLDEQKRWCDKDRQQEVLAQKPWPYHLSRRRSAHVAPDRGFRFTR